MKKVFLLAIVLLTMASGAVLAGEGNDLIILRHGEGADPVPVLPVVHGEGDDDASFVWTLGGHCEQRDTGGNRPGHGSSNDGDSRTCEFFSVLFANFNPIGFEVCGEEKITITVNVVDGTVVVSREIVRFNITRSDAGG